MRLSVLLFSCALCASCSPDEPTPPAVTKLDAQPVVDSAALTEARNNFTNLDFEGRWGWYRREVRDLETERSWAAWLQERGESEFLEWLALCRAERFAIYGGALMAADDPRWLRVAAWTLDSTVPADVDAARESLLARDGLTLDWLAMHTGALSPSETALLEELTKAAPTPELSTNYEAPLTEATVYLGLLREARFVADGTATSAPGEEQPARGDAARSIQALRVSGRRSPQVLDALAVVALHPDSTLSMAVAKTALSLRPDEVPTFALLKVMREKERPMALREDALEAVAHGSRFAAYVEFCKLALSPRDPLWPAAVRQLGKFGDRFAASCLSDLTDEELDQEQRNLRDAALESIAARGELSDDQFVAQLTDYMERMTYADLAGGLIRDKALAELLEELRERLHSYDLKYELKAVMVQYQAPTRLPVNLDEVLWTARLHEHCTDGISY